MSAPGALHSDHVNYLIFRYLQEHGHEDTARSFWRDWHRPRQYRDPEDLPFARDVTRFELISVIQDGLRLDDMQSRVGASRRHGWSLVDPRKPVEDDSAGMNGSRPSSSGKRKSIGTGAGAEAYTSGIKRQRISSLPDVQTNGHRDLMDVDARSSSVEDEDIEDAVSPAVGSDTATDAPATRYDSVATQTEVVNGQKIPPNRLRQHAITLDLDKGSAKALHAAWSPSKEGKTKNTLFLTGKSLCRMYTTPDYIDDTTKSTAMEHMDEPAITDDSMVTSMAWHPDGRILTCAVDTLEIAQSGKRIPSRRIVSIGPDMGTYTHFPSTELLQPPGLALSVEYSPSGDYLMIAKTNMSRGLVEIWPALHTKVADLPTTQPLAWKIFEHSLSEAAWVSDNEIMACSHTENAWVLRLSETFTHVDTFAEQAIAEHNVKSTAIILPARGEVQVTFKRDGIHAMDVFFIRPYDQLAGQDKMVIFDSALYATDAYLKVQKSLDLHWSFIDAAVQPVKHQNTPDAVANYGPARLLALILEQGGCQLYQLNRDANGVICKPLFSESGYTFKMSHGTAQALAWSPDGQFLAIAGKAMVQVWHLASTEALDKRPVLTWRASTPFIDDVEPVNGAEPASKPVCLTWDADGRKICYAVDSKIAIIACEAPQEPVVNGAT